MDKIVDLRDYLASAALQGFLAGPIYQQTLKFYHGARAEKEAAEAAYRMADAMMAAREKEEA